jgi:glycosyltransferase involved in cell wall biosynthesis
MNKVTVVIPCYNYAQYLPDAIESCLNQTVPVDIVVVNDGSTDLTDSVMDNYVFFNNVQYVKQQNKGLAAARNAGIALASTEWVLPLDADDKIDEECVVKLLQYADKADILVPGQQTFGDTSIYYPFSHKNFSFAGFFESNQAHCSCLYRKSMWQQLGGYDETMKLGYEDWDFWLRAAKAGYRFQSVSEPLFFYRKHGESLVSIAGANQKEIINYIRTKNGESKKEAS